MISFIYTEPNDIVECNLKQILTLLWQLVVHYQVTKANQESKLLLLNWMDATLPDKNITNFTTDWNDGINLSALVDYCKPGLIPNHPFLEPSNALENITKAMALAEQHLGIPQIMQPDDFAAEKPDEQSVMTYLSLFCCPTSPGEERLLSWIQKQIPSNNVTNLTTDWVSGEALGMLVNEVSANAYPTYDQHQHTSEEDNMENCNKEDTENCKKSMDAAEEFLGIQSILKPEEFANPELSPIARATYLIQFYFAKICPKVMDLHIPSKAGSGEMVWVDLLCSEESLIVGQAYGSANGSVPVETDTLTPNTYRVSFEAKYEDTYTLAVYVNGNRVKDSPFHVDLTPSSVELINSIPPNRVGLPVSLFFDTSDAGTGEMTAQAKGEKSGQAPCHIKQISASEYKVFFVPLEGDTYTLEVHFDRKQVQGSPFVFPLTSIAQPGNVKCGEPVFSQPHTPVILDIDVTNAGTGELTATCRGETSGEIEVSFTWKHDHPTGLTFVPPLQEIYTLSVYFEEVEVNNSPFFIDLRHIPPDATKVAVLRSPSRRLNAGEEIKICFDTTEAGTGKLTAFCKGTNVGDVPLTARQCSNYTHNVVFTPPEEDTYSIGVFWADNHIRGSPFKVTLTPKGEPDASKCRVVSSLVKSSFVNENISFEIDTADAGRGSLSVTATTQEGAAQTPYIEPIPERPEVFKISYTPTTPGTHTLNLLWANKALPFSPLRLKIKEIKLVPFGVPVVVNMMAKCRKVHLKAFAVHKERDSRHNITIKETEKEHFRLSLKAKKEGLYLLHIQHQEREIPGSPLAVNYVTYSSGKKSENKEDGYIDFVVESELREKRTKPTRKAKKVRKAKREVIGLDLHDIVLRVGVSHSFKLHCEELGKGIPEVTCNPEGGADITCTLVEGEKNTHLVKIEPLKVGKHVISVKFDGKHILGSPFKVEFKTRSDASKCILEDSPPKCQKMSAKGNIIFCISNKGAGKGKLMAAVKSDKTKETLPIDISHPFKQHYHIEFNPSEGLDYVLTIKYDHTHIPGSPFKLALSDSTKVRMEGEGSIEAWLNERNCFIVDGKDAGAAQLKVFIEGCSEELKCVEEKEAEKLLKMGDKQPRQGVYTITKVAEKVFRIGYIPIKQGFYTITVKWGNLDIPSSPCDVKCRKRIFPKDVYITNPSGGAYIGKPLKLKLVAKDTEIEEEEYQRFTVLIRSNVDLQFPWEIEKGDSGSCICTIDPPPTVGVYEFHVLWMGEHITGSPSELEIAPKPTPKDFTAKNVESEIGGIAVEVHGPKFAHRCGEMEASVEIEGTNETLPIIAAPLSLELYKVEFNPQKCGVYWLSIVYDEEHIQGSPFRLVATDPSRCYTKGRGLKTAKVGEENNFAVCVENAGPGELTVHIEGVEGEIIEPLITEASDTRYEVTYNPPKLGTYRILVQWDKQHVSGSPFEVLCVNAARYSVVKPPKQIFCGNPITVTAKALDRKVPTWEKLEIIASSKGHTTKGEVEKTGSKNYTCTVVPTKIGKYQVYVRCNGLDIIGSPFRTKVVAAPSPENITVYGEGLKQGMIGQEQFFTIQLTNPGHGYLGVRVKGPKGGFTINLDKPDKENCIPARYTPMYAGDYTISVLWAEVHVPGSPFCVSIAAPEDTSHEDNADSNEPSPEDNADSDDQSHDDSSDSDESSYDENEPSRDDSEETSSCEE